MKIKFIGSMLWHEHRFNERNREYAGRRMLTMVNKEKKLKTKMRLSCWCRLILRMPFSSQNAYKNCSFLTTFMSFILSFDSHSPIKSRNKIICDSNTITSVGVIRRNRFENKSKMSKYYIFTNMYSYYYDDDKKWSVYLHRMHMCRV